MSIKSNAMILGGSVVLVILAAWYAKRQAGAALSAVVDTAQKVVPYVNPADRNNVAYSGVNAVGAAVTGDSSWSLGGSLYDLDQYINNALNGLSKPPEYQIPSDFGVTNPAGGW